MAETNTRLLSNYPPIKLVKKVKKKKLVHVTVNL